MSPEQWRQVKQILQAVLELPEQKHAAFLEKKCGSDVDLRREVEALLCAGEGHVAFIEHAIVAPGVSPVDIKAETIIGSYRLVRELGRGGMSTVFLAIREDDVFRKLVALKILKPEMETAHIVRRFEMERQILANLSHPNIAGIMDGGATSNRLPYFVMEYVEGQPLNQYCGTRHLSTRARLKLVQKVCCAVHFAHQNLIVHRDLKPSNILVTPEGEPKLLDFGIAKLLQPEHFPPLPMTAVGFRFMTPEYASPEQVFGETITTASDIYALGILTYELLTGRRPYRFRDRSEAEVRRVISETEPEKPSASIEKSRDLDADSTLFDYQRRGLCRALKGDVDNIVLKALRKDPQRRYASAEQLERDIGRHLAGFPVSAGKGAWLYRTKKFIRRHRVGVAVVATGILLILGFAMAMAFQQKKILRERDRAKRVSEFLVNLFELSDPYETDGSNVTARALLDHTAGEIGRELQEEPEIRAAMMETMGRVYHNLELFDSARPLLEEALRIRRDTGGPSHADTDQSQFYLAVLLLDQGHYRVAEQLFNQILELRRGRLGASPLRIAEVLNGIAQANYAQGKYPEARRTYRQSMALQEGASALETQTMARTLNHLANTCYQLADYEAAEKHLHRAITILSHLKGTHHPLYATALDDLGILCRQLERFDEALSLFNRALGIRQKALSPNSLQIAASFNNLALLYRSLGNYPESETFLLRALSIREEKLGSEHADVAQSLNNLAWLCMTQKRYPEAQELHQRALSIREQLFGRESLDVASSLNNLANAHVFQKNYGEAFPLYQRAQTIFEKALGKEHLYVSYCLHGQGDIYLAQGNFAEAEPLLQRALRIREQGVGNQHELVADVLISLVKLLRETEQIEEAIKMERRISAIQKRKSLQAGNDKAR